MAAVALGSKAVGSIIKLKIDGVLKNFLIVHQGKPSSLYDASCDGTWLLMEGIYENRQWLSYNANNYANSDIHKYLNNTWINKLDASIPAKQVKIPYVNTAGGGAIASGANGLSCKAFLLSGYEVGATQSMDADFPVDGAVLDYFKGMAATDSRRGPYTLWWLRSAIATSTDRGVWHVESNGSLSKNGASTSDLGIRPVIILPSSLFITDDGLITTNTAPTTPGSITIPDTIQGGSTINLSWAPSTDAQGNLEGYIVERSVNGGTSWTQIYQGSALSTTNTIPLGTQSVM